MKCKNRSTRLHRVIDNSAPLLGASLRARLREEKKKEKKKKEKKKKKKGGEKKNSRPGSVKCK